MIGEMVDLCETLVKGMDRASTAENVNGFYKLSQSLAGLTRSRVDIEKLNLETKGLHDRAFQSIQDHIRVQLQGRPELVAELIEISEAVNEQILNTKAIGPPYPANTYPRGLILEWEVERPQFFQPGFGLYLRSFFRPKVALYEVSFLHYFVDHAIVKTLSIY